MASVEEALHMVSIWLLSVIKEDSSFPSGSATAATTVLLSIAEDSRATDMMELDFDAD